MLNRCHNHPVTVFISMHMQTYTILSSVGSLYPNSANVAEKKRAVVPVIKSSSSSISLSLPVMLASKSAVIACAGKDAKSPLGKAEAMVSSKCCDTFW